MADAKSVWSWRKLLKPVQSSYIDPGGKWCKWFLVDVGLRQGCGKTPWLFNVYMDGVV